MKEKDLIQLGFVKENSTDLIDGIPSFYYYVKDIQSIALISNASDEIEGDIFFDIEDRWFVEFFDTNIRYYQLEDVKQLIAILEKGIHEKTNNQATPRT